LAQLTQISPNNENIEELTKEELMNKYNLQISEMTEMRRTHSA